MFKSIKELIQQRALNRELKRENAIADRRIEEVNKNNLILAECNNILLEALNEVRQECQKNQYNSIVNFRAKINKILDIAKSKLASY